MNGVNGRFVKGTHWRPHKPYWERDWLYCEYVEKLRSAQEIAEQFGITENGILYWLDKLAIPARTMSEIRAIKHWGAEREANPMYGRRGPDNVNWKGGTTPERQSLYSSIEWHDLEKAVLQRDGHVCKRCGKAVRRSHRLHLHHIISFDVADSRLDPDNVVPLCSKCHGFVHSRANILNEFRKEVMPSE